MGVSSDDRWRVEIRIPRDLWQDPALDREAYLRQRAWDYAQKVPGWVCVEREVHTDPHLVRVLLTFAPAGGRAPTEDARVVP